MFSNNLKNTDVEISNLINEEFERQKNNIELIASENFTSKAVIECLGSVLTNKYSEGRPNRRYYGGNQIIDKIEKLCETRALNAFDLDPNIWNVNVQPYSGSPANFAVYTGLLQPGDKILALDLKSGGHLSHGYKTYKKKISATSKYFDTEFYYVNKDGYINYKEIEEKAIKFKPKIIICGASAYPRDYDYLKFREICDKVGALLMSDIAHISGLVVTKEMNNPFEYSDIVTSTTHKTLRGPRSGIIFCKKKYSLDINNAVFPGLQGGPHNHQIAALAVQLKEVQTENFHKYIIKVKENAKFLSKKLIEKGFNVCTNGTDNHLLLISLKNFDITGSKMEKVCELVNISLNKNCIPGDTSALKPNGIRIGTPCMTTRGMDKDGWNRLSCWLKECVDICIERQNKLGRKLKNWSENIEKDLRIVKLRDEIINYAKTLKFYN